MVEIYIENIVPQKSFTMTTTGGREFDQPKDVVTQTLPNFTFTYLESISISISTAQMINSDSNVSSRSSATGVEFELEFQGLQLANQTIEVERRGRTDPNDVPYDNSVIEPLDIYADGPLDIITKTGLIGNNSVASGKTLDFTYQIGLIGRRP